MSLASYLTLPENQNGKSCTGGYGDTDEEFTLVSNAPFSAVKTITFWGLSGTFRGIRIQFYDDTSVYTAGTMSGSDSVSCTFGPGETLTGDIKLSDNDKGTHLGYFYAETNAGTKCEAGDDSRTKYLYPTGGGFFGGLHGAAGDQINHAGPILWKTIDKVVLSQISYPDFDTRSKVVSPSLISEHTYCNEADEEMPFESFTQTTELSTGTESCFTLGGTFEFGQSYQFEATVNVPTLGSARALQVRNGN